MLDSPHDSSMWLVSILVHGQSRVTIGAKKLSEGQLSKVPEKIAEVTAVVTLLDREQSIHVILSFFCGLQCSASESYHKAQRLSTAYHS